MNTKSSLGILSLCLGVLSTLLVAQRSEGSLDGRVHGVVKDPQGGVVSLAIEIEADEPSTTLHKITVRTDQFGKYAVVLAAGEYRACARMRGFEETCHCVHVEKGYDTEKDFSMRADKAYVLPTDYDPMDRRLQLMAGKGAINCGHVYVDRSPRKPTACALAAHKHNKAFLIRYDVPCGDCQMSAGLAADALGRLFAVHFDSIGITTWELSPAETMPDGIFTLVAPCPPRPGLRVTRAGALSCFSKNDETYNIIQELDDPEAGYSKPK